jgi:uncharacterized protein (TIGR03000 family)
MFLKARPMGVMLSLGAALALLSPAPSAAAGHGGGGHFGGGHFGGFRGGAHLGGFHGGARLGGFHGTFRPGHSAFRSRPHYGYRRYSRYYRGYGGYSSYYPYSNYYPGYYAPYLGSGYGEEPDDSDATEDGTPPATSAAPAPPEPAQADTRAYVHLHLPAGAQVWVEGKKMTSTGRHRTFHSPLLQPGKRYVYHVRARWREHGHEVTQTREVKVWAGADLSVTFPVPPSRTKASAKAD